MESGGLTGLDQNPDPNILEFDPTAITGSFTKFLIGMGGGDDTFTILSMRDGLEGVETTVGDGVDTVIVGGDLGTAGAGIGSQVYLRGESIELNGAIYADNQNVILDGNVLLTGNSTVVSGTTSGIIDVRGGIDGAFSLTTQSGAWSKVQGAIGATIPLSILDMDAATFLNIDGTVSVVGDINLSGTTNINLGDDVSSSTGSIAFDVPWTHLSTATVHNFDAAGNFSTTGGIQGIQAPNNLVVDVGGNVEIAAAVTALNDFYIFADGAVDLDDVLGDDDIRIEAGTTIEAFGFHAYDGNVILRGDVTFDSTQTMTVHATNDILFDGPVFGNGLTMSIRDARTVAFNGPLTNVGTLDIYRGGSLVLESVTLGAVSAENILVVGDETTAIKLTGDLTASTDDISLTGSVLLDGSNETITLTTGLGLNDSVIIDGPIDDMTVNTGQKT